MTILRKVTDYDRGLLLMEMGRLKARGYRFAGETDPERLGADAWVLGVSLVEGKVQQPKGRKQGSR